MIELQHVSKTFTFRGKTIEALAPCSLSVPKGAACCLYGRSGSGKTTLLSIAGGMLLPSSGAVRINGTELTALPAHFLAAFRRAHVGFVFQQYQLLPKHTVWENVLTPLLPQGRARLAEAIPKLRALLDRLGLAHRLDLPARHLSGGEQQRVAVARALAADPSVIIADEVFSNLDPANAAVLLELFAERKRRGATLLLSATSQGPEQRLIDQAAAMNDNGEIQPCP